MVGESPQRPVPFTPSPLFVDVYPGDRRCDWQAFLAAGPPWHGAIFKLSQGLHLEYAAWALAQRQAFVRSERYGVDLWDGFYHYLDFSSDGTRQADWFCHLMDQVGGEKLGTLWAMVDVERGGQAITDPSRAQVEDCTRAFAARYLELSGRQATLYGGELLRSVGAQNRLGCGRSAIALYGAELHGRSEGTADLLRRTGTDLAHLTLWQYRGTEPQTVGPRGYPLEAPGCGAVDISALVLPGGLEALRSTLWAERPPG